MSHFINMRENQGESLTWQVDGSCLSLCDYTCMDVCVHVYILMPAFSLVYITIYVKI